MQTLQIIDKEHFRVIQLDRGKANPMNRQMIHQLSQAIHQAAQDQAVKGVILTGKPHYFSAGLDLVELFQYSPEEMKTFWLEFSQMMTTLVEFPKPLVAAISGHSPAGGCVLSLCCDYRIMAEGDYRIGLNEVPVGIIVPPHIFALYAFVIGENKAYQYLLEGRLLSVSEAAQVGLIDEAKPLEEVLAAAERKMQQYLALDATTLQRTKQNLRKNILQHLRSVSEEDFKATLEHWWSPEVRHILHGILQKLKK